MRQNQQTTLHAAVTLSGCGVHSGDDVRLVLHPAESNHGIVFLRTGLPGGRDRLIDARHVAVSATELCTVIGERESGAVATTEHLMSALYGAGVDNVLVEIDGVEVPILDGSAAPFVDAIDQVGVAFCSAPRRYLKVLKPVRATQGKAFAELRPDDAFRLDVEIDFGDDIIVNPEGLRYPDEFVRHKMLDAIGDLALAGSPLLGAYRSFCGGHRLNFAVLEALFSDRSNYSVVEGGTRRETGYAEIGNGIAVPAFAADSH